MDLTAVFLGPDASAAIGFIQDGTDAVATTVQVKLRQIVSVIDFGAVGDGVTDDTAAFVAAYDYAVANGKGLYIPAGTYRAYLVIKASNFTIFGDGSATTIIKLPDYATHTIIVGSGPSTQTGVPCVLDFGQIGAGNDAEPRSGAHLHGLTLDGNRDNTEAPSSDIFGWGLTFTAFSNVTYHDIVAQNCHCGGFGTFINSNFHAASNWRAKNCGFALGHPGFDVNSSKYGVWSSGSVDSSKNGVRIIDNCWNNKLDCSVYNAENSGFIYNNQLGEMPGSGNYSENNDVSVRVYGGCVSGGVQIGAKCSASKIDALIVNTLYCGINEVAQLDPADNPNGNFYNIVTRNNAASSCLIGGDSSVWNVITTNDGRSGPQGSFFAVVVSGNRNTMTVNLQDTSPWQVRGIQFDATATSNNIASYSYTNTGQSLLDGGMTNRYILHGSATYDPPSLVDGAGATAAVAVSGARLGMIASAGFSNDVQGLLVSASVQLADTVTVRFFNDTGGTVNLASGTLNVVVNAV